MSRTIVLKKATRIEGNADVEIEINGGRVLSARFVVHDFRGLEKFLCGRRVESVPHLISRICGLCSASQQVASLEAIESALGVVTPKSVKALRETVVFGEWISSHALSYFFLSRPDFVGTARGIFDLMEKEPEIAGRAMAVRGAGQRIVELIGKRAVHPVSMGIGRFTEEPTAETLLEVRQIARELKSLSRDLIERVESSEFSGKTIPFPDNHGVHFLCYEEGEEGGVFAIYDRSGVLVDTFAREDFEQNIAEMRAGWSFAKFPYLTRLGFPDGILLVGPLSRLFRPGGLLEDGEVGSLPLADRLRDPRVLSLGDYDLCRLLEIYWAAIRVERLMEEVDLDEKTPAVDREQSGLGIGVVEAPRGVLVHNYLIKNGCIEKIRLLVATQFNNPFINLMIGEIASANVRDGVLSEEGEKLVGHCIRVFDPCLSCATH